MDTSRWRSWPDAKKLKSLYHHFPTSINAVYTNQLAQKRNSHLTEFNKTYSRSQLFLKITRFEAPEADQVQWEACHLFVSFCKLHLETLKVIFHCFRLYPQDCPCLTHITAIRTYTDNIVNAPTSHSLIWTHNLAGLTHKHWNLFIINFRLHQTYKRSALRCPQT